MLHRGAIIPVVTLDGSANIWCDGVYGRDLQGTFNHPQMCSGGRQINGPYEVVELLHILYRVVLHASENGMLDDRMEVHEQLGAQHAIDVRLPRCMTAHQPLEGRGLVRGVVVDMHRRRCYPGLIDEVDDRLKGGTLLTVRVRPVRAICRRTTSDEKNAEQILPPTVAGERVALEVQEHVTRRGCW